MRAQLRENGPALGMSLTLHLLLFLALAVPVLHHVTPARGVAATITNEIGEPFELGGMFDTELAQPGGGGAMRLELPELAAPDSAAAVAALLDAPADLGAATGIGVGGNGDGAGGNGNGTGFFVPANAVSAGSFTAFATPTFNAAFPKRLGMADPQPGDAPQPRQPYLITIQIKVPGNRKTYSLHDLSGTVEGTDGWRQSFPIERGRGRSSVFVMSADGTLARLQNNVRVVNGVVQIVVLVPGAVELVKDVIQINSKMLDESQTLEIVFQESPEE